MRMEFTLAKRYIFAQKRHAILTIFSIAISVTMIVVLSIAYSTITQISYNSAYDAQPYHVLVGDVTEEQAKTIASQEYIQSCTIRNAVEFKDKCKTEAVIFLTKDVHVPYKTIDEALKKANINSNDVSISYSNLMNVEHLGDDAKLELLVTYAILFLFALIIAFALRLVIDTAFEVSSKEREKQFGVLQSIGATPKQIVRIITNEGLLLSVIGLPLGVGLGIGTSYIIYRLILSTGFAESFWSAEKISHIVHFTINPILLLAAIIIGAAWVLFSAYGTGMRIVRMSPIEAIQGQKRKIVKSKKHRLAGLLFGWIGTLSAKNVRRLPKRFVITVLSLTLSMTLFASFSYILNIADQSTQSLIYSMWGEVKEDFEFSIAKQPNQENDYREYMKQLDDSGYFKQIDPHLTVSAHNADDQSDDIHYSISYMPKDVYEANFDGKPPISYEELAASGKYVEIKAYSVSEFGGVLDFTDVTPKGDSLELTFTTGYEITEKEYNDNHTEGDQTYTEWGVESDADHKFIRKGEEKIRCDIAAVYDPLEVLGEQVYHARYPDEKYVSFIGTLDTYDQSAHTQLEHELFRLLWDGNMFSCCLKDDANYQQAIDFLNRSMHAENMIDFYGDNLMISRTLSAVRICMGAFTVLIALIAIINMINIISTSLLNRKSEFAALRSIGMSDKQLMKLTVAEALQYVCTAGIFAVILCEGLMFLTMQFLKVLTIYEENAALISFTYPLPRLGIAFAASLLIALAATLIPILRMRNDSIVDSIRNVE